MIPEPTSLETSTTGHATSVRASTEPSDLLLERPVRRDQIGEPERQAIDEHRAPRPTRGTKRLCQLERLLDRQPVRAAAGAVRQNPRAHLVVARRGGSNVDGRLAARPHCGFGKAALARIVDRRGRERGACQPSESPSALLVTVRCRNPRRGDRVSNGAPEPWRCRIGWSRDRAPCPVDPALGRPDGQRRPISSPAGSCPPLRNDQAEFDRGFRLAPVHHRLMATAARRFQRRTIGKSSARMIMPSGTIQNPEDRQKSKQPAEYEQACPARFAGSGCAGERWSCCRYGVWPRR